MSAIWIALWDGKPTLNDGSLVWPLSARARQYAGNVNATYKGITLIVDKDIVGGPVARLLTLRVQLHRHGTVVHANLVRVNRRGLISSRSWPYAVTVLTPSST